MIRFFIIFSFLFFGIFSTPTTQAYQNPGSPEGFVNDYASLLSSQEEQLLENTLIQFESESTNEISIVALPSLEGDTIENFSVQLFEDWAIGKKTQDNGVLILVSLEEKAMRIEVGYGLEGVITDAQAGRVVNTIIKPAFKEGSYYSGLAQAVNALIAISKGESESLSTYSSTISRDTPSAEITDNSQNNLPLLQFFLFGFFALLYAVSLTLGKSKSYWLGGLLGGISGILFGFFIHSLTVGIWSVVILGLLGLLLDYLLSKGILKVSKNRWPNKTSRRGGGFGGSSSGRGGFGGFGGGSSGGGGASGKW